jgi:transcriptional regulator with XRE-family HTH domain
MPTLITQRSKRQKRPVPPCGRLIEYREPHSPFQKLVDDARRAQRLSGRELAAMIVVNGKPLSQSTLWIWLHNVNGYPHPKAFTRQHLTQLARALKIPESKLREALDASRHLFTERETPTPQQSRDAFARFIEILENDSRQTISRSYALNLARNLHAGAIAASTEPHAPASGSSRRAATGSAERPSSRKNNARSRSSRRPL